MFLIVFWGILYYELFNIAKNKETFLYRQNKSFLLKESHKRMTYTLTIIVLNIFFSFFASFLIYSSIYRLFLNMFLKI